MSHYFSDDALGKTHELTVTISGVSYPFLSAAGMFSKDRLDTGSRLLIEESHVPTGARVLDLGCGIGVVGILLALRDQTILMTQTDVTDKAVTLTRMNAKRLHAQTTVVQSDVYDGLGDAQFDVILTNPPRAAGKAVIARMIAQAPNRLARGGSLQLVAMTNKGGESYAKLMKETFGTVETIARGSGFKVYKSVKA